MTLENAIRAIEASFVLISLALGIGVSKYSLLFTAFVGLNLLQSAFTHWCLMEKILQKTGLKPTGGGCCGAEKTRSGREI